MTETTDPRSTSGADTGSGAGGATGDRGALPPWAAVVLDMDGVVTDTASVHAQAWKLLFDEFLADPEVELGPNVDLSPFELPSDYRRYVDGRPREDGVRTFLTARGIFLPEGDDDDPPGAHTVHGLALRKNTYFTEIVEREGVTVFPGTVGLIRRLRRGGIPTGLVTSSRNAHEILDRAAITDLFDVVVDGSYAREHGLPGKPDPATFLEAARLLGSEPADVAVLEDASSGVQAARTGGFGLVVGIAREANRTELEAAGAHLVVGDATELDLGDVRDDPWELAFEGFDPQHEGRREALTTLANGYMSVRGAAPEAPIGSGHYPGSYMAGVFNRLTSHVNGRDIEHESMVNLPRWALCDIRFDDGRWWSDGGFRVVSESRTLSFANGVLTRTAEIVDPADRRLRITQQRLVSMDKHHVAAMLTEITPIGYSGMLHVRTGVDMDVVNDNVAEYEQLAKDHIEKRAALVRPDGTLVVEVETTQSHVRIGIAQHSSLTQEPTHQAAPYVYDASHAYSVSTVEEDRAIYREFAVPVESGYSISVDTTTAIVNSRDSAITSVREGVARQIEWLPEVGFHALLGGHASAVQRLWERFDVAVDADAQTQLIIHLHTFHLLQSLSPHTVYVDAGTPARGLHGEGYRGHIFWDELFVLPLLNLRLPEISKALLLYRWRRLDSARHNARLAGHRGAMFPWQSGSDGREETPIELYNPRSRRWMPDNSRRQFHVGLSIAYNAWQHYRATADTSWLAGPGGELLIEVVRLFASLSTYDATMDRFHIRNVMGPDEFHDGYPGTPGSGIDDNAYTNVLTAWVCRHAVEIFRVLSSHEAEDLIFRLGIQPAEITHWGRLAARLYVPFNSDGVISQFEGYDELRELDWARYRRTYGNIGRMDLIMESEGDSTNEYKLSKQADVNMLFFLLGPEGVVKELRRLGYEFTQDQVERTIEYYVQRSTNGSTLSNVVNAGVLASIGREEAWDAWQNALVADINDTQWGTTQEGIHLGAMAGTVDVIIRAFAGVVLRFDKIEFRPRVPERIGSVRFRVLFQEHLIEVRVDRTEIVLRSRSHETNRVKVQVFEEQRYLEGGAMLTFPLPAPESPVEFGTHTADGNEAEAGPEDPATDPSDNRGV
ncbi:beta-phosphoglucomutase family hydrolase [Brevibacterium samyangense]|uniref:Beta-phosphoglucomutase family hydrolase n=1 Tax=Brevibacterium samyangense TaxID=366888 RepID=A0ABN2TI05_9MICO